MTKRKKTLVLDFDGVIHSYTSGWLGPDVIPDPPVPGAIAFLIEAAKHFEVHIFSSRSSLYGGIPAMQWWLFHHLHNDDVSGLIDHSVCTELVFKVIQWPTTKPPAYVTLDDRAITFTGEWPSIDSLLEFKPWNKREPQPPSIDKPEEKKPYYVTDLYGNKLRHG